MRVNRVDRVPPSMPINTIPLLQEGVRGRPRFPRLLAKCATQSNYGFDAASCVNGIVTLPETPSSPHNT